MLLFGLIAAAVLPTFLGQPPPQAVSAYLGSTPTIDGFLRPSEWEDATRIDGSNWVDRFNGTLSRADLCVESVWLKHDGHSLFIALNVTDDVLFLEPEWTPPGNSNVDDFNATGWPWWGDDVELVLNALDTPHANCSVNCSVSGSPRSWQMATNLHKRVLHGAQQFEPGIMPSEPRTTAWPVYLSWIQSGAMFSAVAPFAGAGFYTLEWEISLALLPVVPAGGGEPQPWSPAHGRAAYGLNIAVQDVDGPNAVAPSAAAFGLHHEVWWNAATQSPFNLQSLGVLWLEPGPSL